MTQDIVVALGLVADDYVHQGKISIDSLIQVEQSLLQFLRQRQQNRLPEGRFVFDNLAFITTLRLRLRIEDLTTRQAAEQMSLSFSTISRIMRPGDGEPSLSTLTTVCNWLKLDPSVFFKQIAPLDIQDDTAHSKVNY